MNLPFIKMHGCGNDYIYFDRITHTDLFPDPEKLAVALSDRRFGIGGDGIVLICPSTVADVRMRMFNADGSEGNMCGNAIRCVGKYCAEAGIVTGDSLTVETRSGIKTLALTRDAGGAVTGVRVDMGAPILVPAAVPVSLTGGPVIARPTVVAGGKYTITTVSMGNPHCVLFSGQGWNFDLASLDLEKIGPAFEHDPLFPERVNTEFAVVEGPTSIAMRVWERGSGETWACGTGACATAVAAVACGLSPRNADITLHLRGGDLTIRYTDETVYMTGPATEVFRGEVRVD